MKVCIGSDHRGNDLRFKLTTYITNLGHECEDLGMNGDFPLIAKEVCRRIIENKCDMGILICGTGQGMAIAANKCHQNIIAAVCNTVKSAKQAREHLDANILTIGADYVQEEEAKEIIQAFLVTPFIPEERYKRRIEQMKEMK